jgi:hypothetical protein
MGAPNTAMKPSPRNLFTMHWWRFTLSIHEAKQPIEILDDLFRPLPLGEGRDVAQGVEVGFVPDRPHEGKPQERVGP